MTKNSVIITSLNTYVPPKIVVLEVSMPSSVMGETSVHIDGTNPIIEDGDDDDYEINAKQNSDVSVWEDDDEILDGI